MRCPVIRLIPNVLKRKKETKSRSLQKCNNNNKNKIIITTQFHDLMPGQISFQPEETPGYISIPTCTNNTERSLLFRKTIDGASRVDQSATQRRAQPSCLSFHSHLTESLICLFLSSQRGNPRRDPEPSSRAAQPEHDMQTYSSPVFINSSGKTILKIK